MKKPKFTDSWFEVLVDDPKSRGGVSVTQANLVETPLIGA